MRLLRALGGGALIAYMLLLASCSSAEDRRERTLRFYRETLLGAQQQYEELKTKAASAVGGIEGAAKTVQEEILELERKIGEAQNAILKIQEGAGELSEGMQNLGTAVTGGNEGAVDP